MTPGGDALGIAILNALDGAAPVDFTPAEREASMKAMGNAIYDGAAPPGVHAIDGAAHTSTATPGKMLKAAAVTGLPVDATNTDAEVSGAVSASHAQAHSHAGGAGDAKLVQANTHETPDTDAAAGSLHHTLGAGANQAAAGNHGHAHNATTSKQGGDGATQFYHLTLANHDAVFNDGWDDLVLEATGVNPPGGVTAVVYNPTQSTLDWQDNNDCRADFNFQLPHRWHEGTTTNFHLHVLHADASAGNSRWSVKWRILDRDEAQPAWTTDATISIAAPGSTNHVILPIKAFTMTGYRVSCIVQVQLTRLAQSDALDTYEADIQMMSADLHYQSDTMTGSAAEGVK